MPIQQVSQTLNKEQSVSFQVDDHMTIVNYGSGELRLSMNSIDPVEGAANCFLLHANMSFSASAEPVGFLLKLYAEKNNTDFTLVTGVKGSAAFGG